MSAGQLPRTELGVVISDKAPAPSLTPYSDQAAAATWGANKLVAMKVPRPDNDETDAAYKRGLEAGYLIAVMRLREYASVARAMAAKVADVSR